MEIVGCGVQDEILSRHLATYIIDLFLHVQDLKLRDNPPYTVYFFVNEICECKVQDEMLRLRILEYRISYIISKIYCHALVI